MFPVLCNILSFLPVTVGIGADGYGYGAPDQYPDVGIWLMKEWMD
jgi:hypothetical protein